MAIKVLSPVPLPWLEPYVKSIIRRVDADINVTILSMGKALSPRPHLDFPNLSRLLSVSGVVPVEPSNITVVHL